MIWTFPGAMFTTSRSAALNGWPGPVTVPGRSWQTAPVSCACWPGPTTRHTRSHPVDDWEGLAARMAAFFAEDPSMAATTACFRLGIEAAGVRRQAAGLTLAQVTEHGKPERATFTQARAGEDPEAVAIYRAQARWHEWLRIQDLMKKAGHTTYDPSRDPHASQHDA